MRRARGRLACAYGLDPGQRDEGKLLYSPYVVEGYRSLKNSSAPHLHFHVMTSPSVLGSEGFPYEHDSFELAGRGTDAQLDAARRGRGSASSSTATSGTP